MSRNQKISSKSGEKERRLMLIVVTGNGKGKTTSALGQALRAVGERKKAIMVQFIKGPWVSGEDKSAKRLAPDFEIVKGGKGFVGIQGDDLPREEHEQAARDTWEQVQKAVTSGEYDLVIADELNVALHLDLLDIKPVLTFLQKYKDDLDIMVTGRYASDEMLAAADLASEVKEVKHPFNKGEVARRGLEY